MQNENKIGKIYLASDHAGFEMKEKVKEFLVAEYMDIKIIDEGNYVYDEKDDYTDYIHKAGHKLSQDVSGGAAVKSVAIVFGGSGEGEGMVMNRYDGVRCTTYYGNNLDIVKLGRQHNDANSISFGARFVDYEECVEAVKIFLHTNFEGERHIKRVNKIDHKFGFLSRLFK